MPAQHVARAAAVLVAASAIAVPADAAEAHDLSRGSFVEVLLGPDVDPNGGFTIESINAGCAEH